MDGYLEVFFYSKINVGKMIINYTITFIIEILKNEIQVKIVFNSSKSGDIIAVYLKWETLDENFIKYKMY